MPQFDPWNPSREEYASDQRKVAALERRIASLEAALSKALSAGRTTATGPTLYTPPAGAGGGDTGGSATSGVTVRGQDSTGAAKVVTGVTDIEVNNGVITVVSGSAIRIDIIGVNDQ